MLMGIALLVGRAGHPVASYLQAMKDPQFCNLGTVSASNMGCGQRRAWLRSLMGYARFRARWT